MTVNDVVAYLFSIAPEYMKETWDNVGLVCGHGENSVSRVLVALDVSHDVLTEAKEKGCQLVVSHHPMIFGGIQKINDTTVAGKNLLFAIENNIACVNMHTNLDCVFGGVNDILARKLDLNEIAMMNPKGTDGENREYGYVRYGTVKECDLETFAKFVKERLDCRGLRFADGGRPVKYVAVGGGACGDEIDAVIASGCDTFVTADIKYHQFAEASARGLNLIDAGHYQTEVPVCGMLAQQLAERFPELDVMISEKQDDTIRFL